jgi:hypothetical protein
VGPHPGTHPSAVCILYPGEACVLGVLVIGVPPIRGHFLTLPGGVWGGVWGVSGGVSGGVGYLPRIPHLGMGVEMCVCGVGVHGVGWVPLGRGPGWGSRMGGHPGMGVPGGTRDGGPNVVSLFL